MKIMFLLLLTSIFTQAQILPAKSPKCADRIHIRIPKNGTGLFFNETCTAAFVMPPQGSVEVTNVAPTVSAESCPVLNGRLEAANDYQTRLNSLVKSLTAVKKPSDPMDPFAPPEPPPVDRKAVQEEIDGIIREQDRLIESVKPNAMLEAGTLSIVFRSKLQKMVGEYQKLNPSVQFFAMPIKSAAFSVVRKKILKPESLPAVLHAAVPGIEYSNPILSGNPLPDPNNEKEELRYSNEDSKSYVFSDSMTGSITLSLVGACPFYNPKLKTIDPTITANRLTAHLAANVTYAYDLQAFAKYRASFNLANLVRRIQKETTSGGLFSTSSAVEIVTEKDSSDWFEFKSEEDDSELQVGVTAQDVKADLLDRVIRQIGYASIPGVDRMMDPAAPPVHGATVAANELQKCMHIYCQAAAIGLRVLDSIFGSSEASQSFISRSNYTATDVVESRRMIRYQGSFTFVPEASR